MKMTDPDEQARLSLTGRLPTYSESVDPIRGSERDRDRDECRLCSRSHRTVPGSCRSYGTIGRIDSINENMVSGHAGPRLGAAPNISVRDRDRGSQRDRTMDRPRPRSPTITAAADRINSHNHLLLMTEQVSAVHPPVKDFNHTIFGCYRNCCLSLVTVICPCYVVSLINFRLKHPRRAILLGTCVFFFILLLLVSSIYQVVESEEIENFDEYYQLLIKIGIFMSLLVLLVIVGYIRLQTRNKLGYRNDYGADLSVVLLCPCCVVCQMGQELRVDPRRVLGPDLQV